MVLGASGSNERPKTKIQPRCIVYIVHKCRLGYSGGLL